MTFQKIPRLIIGDEHSIRLEKFYHCVMPVTKYGYAIKVKDKRKNLVCPNPECNRGNKKLNRVKIEGYKVIKCNHCRMMFVNKHEFSIMADHAMNMIKEQQKTVT